MWRSVRRMHEEKSASLAKALRFLVEYREYIEYMVQVTLEGRLTEGVFVG
jgi:hypothetical protein